MENNQVFYINLLNSYALNESVTEEGIERNLWFGWLEGAVPVCRAKKAIHKWGEIITLAWYGCFQEFEVDLSGYRHKLLTINIKS